MLEKPKVQGSDTRDDATRYQLPGNKIFNKNRANLHFNTVKQK
jgi:hypothetical protein